MIDPRLAVILDELERLYEVLVDLADRGIIDFESVSSIHDALAIARAWSREAAA